MDIRATSGIFLTKADMTAKIYDFDAPTFVDIPCDKVLEAAVGKLSKVVVLGYEETDGSIYMAASCGNIAEALYLLEKCKKRLLEFGEDQY